MEQEGSLHTLIFLPLSPLFDDVVLDVDASAAVELERHGACTLTDALLSVLPSMSCARLGISDDMANWQLYAVVSINYFNVSLRSS